MLQAQKLLDVYYSSEGRNGQPALSALGLYKQASLCIFLLQSFVACMGDYRVYLLDDALDY